MQAEVELSANRVTSDTFNTARIPNLSAAKLTSTNDPADGQVPSYDVGTGGFSWVDPFDGIERVSYGAENNSCTGSGGNCTDYSRFSILTPQSKPMTCSGGSPIPVLTRLEHAALADSFATIFSFSRTTTATEHEPTTVATIKLVLAEYRFWQFRRASRARDAHDDIGQYNCAGAFVSNQARRGTCPQVVGLQGWTDRRSRT